VRGLGAGAAGGGGVGCVGAAGLGTTAVARDEMAGLQASPELGLGLNEEVRGLNLVSTAKEEENPLCPGFVDA